MKATDVGAAEEELMAEVAAMSLLDPAQLERAGLEVGRAPVAELVNAVGRADLVDFVTEVLKRRTVVASDTTEGRLAELIVTAVLLQIGASLPKAAGVADKPARIVGMSWLAG